MAGVTRGRARAGRLSPLAATERRWPLDAALRLTPKTSDTVAPVSRRTFVATACGRRDSQHERSPNDALITLQEPPGHGPKIEHRPEGRESEEKSLRLTNAQVNTNRSPTEKTHDQNILT